MLVIDNMGRSEDIVLIGSDFAADYCCVNSAGSARGGRDALPLTGYAAADVLWLTPSEVMCRVLVVAPTGYHACNQRPIPNRAIEGARPLRLIRASFTLRLINGTKN